MKKEVCERSLYLDLMERCLLNLIYEDPFTDWIQPGKIQPFDPIKRRRGGGWPVVAHTMIGELRLRNLRELAEKVLHDGIPGDFIETGVWRGGACIMFRAVLKAHGDNHRRVFVADSFEGLPRPNPALYPADAGDKHYQHPALAVSQEDVQSNFQKYDLLDEQVVFLKGWFKDTLPKAPISQIAILRLDGDMYESTMDALNNLYDKVVPNGFVIVDDYGAVVACKKAILDFRRERGITDTIIPIDGRGVYWQKTASVTREACLTLGGGASDEQCGVFADPFWSVIVTSYRRAELLQKNLSSIIANKIDPDRMEILVADDDPGSELSEKVAEWTNGRARYERNTTNMGFFPSLNAAVRRSRGRWIHILADDDMVNPNFYGVLEQLIATTADEFGIIVGNFSLIDEKEKPLWAVKPLADGPGMLGPRFLGQLATINPLQMPAVVMRRDVFDKVGFWREDLPFTGDWEWYMRAALSVRCYFCPEAMAFFRIHHNSQSNALRKTAQSAIDVRKTLEIFRKTLPPKLALNVLPRARQHHALNFLRHAEAACSASLSNVAELFIREACILDPGIVTKQEFTACLDRPQLTSIRPGIMQFVRQMQEENKT